MSSARSHSLSRSLGALFECLIVGEGHEHARARYAAIWRSLMQLDSLFASGERGRISSQSDCICPGPGLDDLPFGWRRLYKVQGPAAGLTYKSSRRPPVRRDLCALGWRLLPIVRDTSLCLCAPSVIFKL